MINKLLYRFFDDVDERRRRGESFGTTQIQQQKKWWKKKYNNPHKKYTAGYSNINIMIYKYSEKVDTVQIAMKIV